jgi:hypothetical protein
MSYLLFVVRAVIALFALLCAQVGPLVHALTTEHATCAEHGELIEVASSSDAEPAAEPVSEGLAISAKSPPADAEHGHDHCLLATHVSPAAEHYLSSWAGPLQLLSHVQALTSVAFVAGDVLTRAPKQSPPARSSLV